MPVKDHRHFRNATDEVVGQPDHITDQLNLVETLHNLFPQNAKLHFSQAITHTTMNAKPKRNV